MIQPAHMIPSSENAGPVSSFTRIVLFLLVAGMEVDLSTVWRQGKVAVWVGSVGIVIPFALGMFAAWLAPQMLGREPDADPLIFALFFGLAAACDRL